MPRPISTKLHDGKVITLMPASATLSITRPAVGSSTKASEQQCPAVTNPCMPLSMVTSARYSSASMSGIFGLIDVQINRLARLLGQGEDLVDGCVRIVGQRRRAADTVRAHAQRLAHRLSGFFTGADIAQGHKLKIDETGHLFTQGEQRLQRIQIRSH